MNKPVEGRAQLRTVPRDLKYYYSAGSIDALEWDFVSPDLQNRALHHVQEVRSKLLSSCTGVRIVMFLPCCAFAGAKPVPPE